jgi:hypothetical protein
VADEESLLPFVHTEIEFPAASNIHRSGFACPRDGTSGQRKFLNRVIQEMGLLATTASLYLKDQQGQVARDALVPSACPEFSKGVPPALRPSSALPFPAGPLRGTSLSCGDQSRATSQIILPLPISPPSPASSPRYSNSFPCRESRVLYSPPPTTFSIALARSENKCKVRGRQSAAPRAQF